MIKRVAVICGGFSSEYDISVKSGTTVKNNLPDGYESYLVLLNSNGWFVDLNGELAALNQNDFSFISLTGEKLTIDLAIVYIHGDPGENGKVQAFLEMIAMPYVNSGPLASQLSFDKWYCNQFLKGFGLKVANSMLLKDRQNIPESTTITQKLGLPLFVKPADSGSSYGISKVTDELELIPSILNAFEEGETVVIESFLKGTEVTCGVYRNVRGVQALPLTEIVSKKDFFDYEAKYQGLSEEITPARIDPSVSARVQEVARQIYDLLNLRSVARIDFMLVENEPYIIEVNTTPGFSAESIVPKMIAAQGLSIKQFWTEIFEAELG